ncbi:NADPH-dependent F420 reductase [Marinoscillum sp.]|uniref:NADPH-dependent F420 reductase n=1 Tax=Marinoscillum sp. TaxID=2024838 RepID=UPI003BA8FFC9
MKKIGIIGSGMVGKALADGFLKEGYAVKIGTRDLSKLADWNAQSGESGSVGSFAEAATFGELVVLAVKGAHVVKVLTSLDEVSLKGKAIIDATNPIDDQAGPENGVLQFFTGPNESLMEQLQSSFPEAHFVKAFNSIGSAHMVHPNFVSKPTMFIAGNHLSAKEEVTEILEQFGWEVADMGAATAARAIEPLSMLWCIPGFTQNQWSHAFKLLK